MSRIKKSAKVAAVCCTFIGGFEGYRQTAYPDPATRGAPWTICFGETKGVRPGDHRTMEQCKTGLVNTADVHADDMEKCIHRDLPDARFIAFTSLAYNIGAARFCKSSVARLYNAGRTQEACDAMLGFNKASVAGALVVFPGLTRRRQAERALCLQGDL